MTHVKKMSLLTKLALTTAAATLLVTGTSFAKPSADTDNDGQVTQAEFMDAAKARFSKGDTNADGLISKEERMAARDLRRAEMKSKRFDRMDTNTDGVITRAEFDALADKQSERRESWRGEGTSDQDRDARKLKRKEMRADRKNKRKERRSMPKVDANADGFISIDEHMAASEAMFLRLDANGDGVLTKGEGRKRGGKRGMK